jgi:hypothetical protein
VNNWDLTLRDVIIPIEFSPRRHVLPRLRVSLDVLITVQKARPL